MNIGQIILGVVAGLVIHVGAAAPLISGVSAQQQSSGFVDITVTMEGASNDVAEAVCTFVATNSATKAAIPIEHITRNGGDVGSDSVWTRKFVWDAKADVGEVKIDDVALTVVVELPLGGVQLWENGPYWAECNVGATKPEETGYFFWWGDTVGYKRNVANNGWVSVKDGLSFSFLSGHCPTYDKNNSQLQSLGYIDSTGNLVAAHDAATAYLGAPWRMPTDAEFDALISNCTRMWTTRNGMRGRLVTGKGAYASKSIFLPAVGYGNASNLDSLGSCGLYWSSTLDSQYSDQALYLVSSSDDFFMHSYNNYEGQSVRPVRGFANASVMAGAVTTHLSIDYANVGRIEVLDVTARQHDASNGFVDIVVTMQGTSNDVANAECSFVATNIATGLAIPVEHITRNGADAESEGVWTRKFIWEAQIDVGAAKIDDVALTVVAEIPVDCVRLWENGPYWAECNVGATKPEEYGCYFWWGDTVGYKRNANDNGWISLEDSSGYSFNNCLTHEKDEAQLRLEGFIDSTGNLVAAHDAATAHLGVPWRMPTDAEVSALLNNCTTEWTSRNGVYGRLVTGKGVYSSRSIFLPAAGYGKDASICDLGTCGRFWSSTPHSDYFRLAWQLYICQDFGSGYFYRYGDSRNYGLSVRPVRGFADADASASSFMTTHLTWEEPLMNEGGPYTESVDGIKWTFVVNSNLEACVYDGSGNGAAVSRDIKGEITIPPKLGGRPVVSIGYYAFSYCHGLTKVVIPESVREVGRSAFYYCDGLTDVKIPDGVKEIDDNAFYYCRALSSFIIPKSLRSIGSDAFYGCSGLDVYVADMNKWCEIDFGNSNANPIHWEGRLYYNDDLVTNLCVPEGVAEIRDFAFYNYDYLDSVSIPNSVTNIGEQVFNGCEYLCSVHVGSGLVHVGAKAFYGYKGYNKNYSRQRRSVYISDLSKWCGVIFDDAGANPLCLDDNQRQSVLFVDGAAVSDLIIPDGVKKIGACAFNYVYGLKSVSIPPSVESVGSAAFYTYEWGGEEAWQAVYIEDLARWAEIAFASYSSNPLYYADHLYLNGKELTTLNIPSSATSIGAYAFMGGESITSVTIPQTVTNIGSGAFSGCNKLATVSIPTSVNHFGANPFRGTAYWASLKDGFVVVNGSLIGYKGDCPSALTIPEGVESICENAFNGCAVTSVVFPDTLARIEGKAFCDCPITALKLPSGIKYIGKDAFRGENLGNYEKYGSIGSILIENVNDLIIDEQAFYGQNLGAVTISGSNVSIGNRAFYQTYDPYGSYRKDGWCNISLTGSGIVVGEEAFANWMHGHAYANLTGVSAIGSKAFSEFGLYYRTSSSSWWEPGDSICVFSRELKHLAVDAFNSASIGRIYLDGIETMFGVDNWVAMNPFACYYRIFRTGNAPSGWEDSWVYDGRNDLLEIEIPAGVEEIPAYAFCCAKVTSVTVPASVKKIGNDAFGSCTFLENITFLGDAPEFVGDPGFYFHIEDSVFWSVPKDKCVVSVIEGMKGWDDDGDGKWLGFTLNYIPMPSYTIAYEGTRGAANSNPSTYKMTDEIAFSALSDREDARFIGWNPAKIEKGSTGDKTVVACWETKTVSDLLKGCGDATPSGAADWFAKWTGSEWVLQSGTIADRQLATLSCKVEGAGALTFKWKVSSDCAEGWQDDYLNVEVDGQEVAWIGGEKGWIEQCIELSANDKPHEVKWNYIKDKSGSAGDDCGWLKDVVWTPDAVAPTFDELAKVFGEDSDVVKNITCETELVAFNDFLKDCSINTASDLKPTQKQYAYKSFKLSEITTAPRLFEEEPVLKIDDLELTGGNLSVTISLTAGSEAIELAYEKLAQKIRVGTSLDSIVAPPEINPRPSADGTSLTFTISKPEGNQGFVKVQID